MIDFGLCTDLWKDGKHIDFANGRNMKGTPYTASIFSHQSQEVSRRDDLISLMYSLMRIGCPEIVPFHDLMLYNEHLDLITQRQRLNDAIFEMKKEMDFEDARYCP